MSATDYDDLAQMLALVAAQVPESDASEVEALLEASKGNDGADPPTYTYRPYWVIANLIQSRVSVNASVKAGSGASVVYRDPTTAIRALMKRQAALDAAIDTIPDGFQAVIAGGITSASLTRTYA